jgi:hypothetical protein
MRFGMVLPLYIANPQRRGYMIQSLASLAKTRIEDLESKPALLFVLKPHPYFDIVAAVSQQGFPSFDTNVIVQPRDAKTVDGPLLFGFDLLLRLHPDLTHVCMLTGDWLYNRFWLLRLRDLIERRPQGKAWWVYHSGHKAIHRTLQEDGEDVRVSSINAGGCLTAEECRKTLEFIDYRIPDVTPPPIFGWSIHDATGEMTMRQAHSPRPLQIPRGLRDEKALHPLRHGLTMDLYDVWLRPGERWVTKVSYILNIGLVGLNQRPDIPELAIDFVGEEAPYEPA